jgi:hypothetical protein
MNQCAGEGRSNLLHWTWLCIPISLLGNGSVNIPMATKDCWRHYYAVRVVSRESRHLVLTRICFPLLNAVLHTSYYSRGLSVSTQMKNKWTWFLFMENAEEMLWQQGNCTVKDNLNETLSTHTLDNVCWKILITVGWNTPNRHCSRSIMHEANTAAVLAGIANNPQVSTMQIAWGSAINHSSAVLCPATS